MSLRDDILAINDVTEELVTIPQWGGKKIKVKSFTAGQRCKLIETCMNKNGTGVDSQKLYIQTMIASACDPDTDELIFTQADYEALSGKNSGAVEIIVSASHRLNGVSNEAVGEMEKNSDSVTQS